MSWNSIGKQSVDVRTSSAVRSSGGGLPCSRHQRKIGSDFPSSVGESRSITHSTFKSELRSFQSPIAAEPYRIAETSRSPKAAFSRSTSAESFCSICSLPVAARPTAAEPAAPETAETAASTRAAPEPPATPAATAPTTAPAAEQVAQQESGQTAATAAAPARAYGE